MAIAESSQASTSKWYVYLVRCADGSLYTGIATDVQRRFAEHQSQAGKCAKYLRGRGPLELVFSTAAGNRAQASQWEYRIKQLTKADKEALVSQRRTLTELLGSAASDEEPAT